MDTARTCACCGEEVTDLPLDYSFSLPDSLFKLGLWQRHHIRHPHRSLVSYKGKEFFVRGVVELSVRETEKSLCFGAWAKVSQYDYNRFLDAWSERAAFVREEVPGELANSLDKSTYPNALGLKLKVIDHQMKAPNFAIDPIDHLLYRSQKSGISLEKVHEIAKEMGLS